MNSQSNVVTIDTSNWDKEVDNGDRIASMPAATKTMGQLKAELAAAQELMAQAEREARQQLEAAVRSERDAKRKLEKEVINAALATK